MKVPTNAEPRAAAVPSSPPAAAVPGPSPASSARAHEPALVPGVARLFEGGSRPANAAATVGAAAPRTSIEKVFAKTVGAAAVAALRASLSSRPVLLIAGDQLTGKSTAAKAVAAQLGGTCSGTGRLVRAAAEEAGKPVEEFVKTVTPSFDVELDWQAAKQIGKGELSVFESRLAGHLGQMLQDLGRQNVVSVYLVASPRERALRYLARELSPAVRERVEPKLHVAADATLEECLAAIVALGDPEASQIAAGMRDIARRDDVDKARLLALYGVDYQDRTAFDVVVVTDGKDAGAVQAEILAAVRARTQG